MTILDNWYSNYRKYIQRTGFSFSPIGHYYLHYHASGKCHFTLWYFVYFVALSSFPELSYLSILCKVLESATKCWKAGKKSRDILAWHHGISFLAHQENDIPLSTSFQALQLFPAFQFELSFQALQSLERAGKSWKAGKESRDILAWHRGVCFPALSSSFQCWKALQRFLKVTKLGRVGKLYKV